MKIYCRVTNTGLIPLYDSDLEEEKKLKIGTDVCVEVKRARNYKFHKKFFALLRLALDNLPDDVSGKYRIYDEESFLLRLKKDFNLFRIVNFGDSNWVVPDSISFEKMDEDTFEAFYRRTVKQITSVYLKGVGESDIEEELYRFL